MEDSLDLSDLDPDFNHSAVSMPSIGFFTPLPQYAKRSKKIQTEDFAGSCESSVDTAEYVLNKNTIESSIQSTESCRSSGGGASISYLEVDCKFEGHFRKKSKSIGEIKDNSGKGNQLIFSSSSGLGVSILEEINAADSSLQCAMEKISKRQTKKMLSMSACASLTSESDFVPCLNSTKSSDSGHPISTLPSPRITYTQYSTSPQKFNWISIKPAALKLNLALMVSHNLKYHLCVTNSSPYWLNCVIECEGNVENFVQLDLPRKVKILPKSSGSLSEDIVLTPLQCGQFAVTLALYHKLPNMPTDVMQRTSILCEIKCQRIKIVPVNATNSIVEINLLPKKKLTTLIEFKVKNRDIVGDIPLRFKLEKSDNSCIYFAPGTNSQHSHICPDTSTLLTKAKVQDIIGIPILIIPNTSKSYSTSIKLLVSTCNTNYENIILIQEVKFNISSNNKTNIYYNN